MFLVGLLSWWYGEGLKARLSQTWQHIRGVTEVFSVGQLLMTLFSPFRQVSAGSSGGSLVDKFQAFIDKTISRFIGAMIRLFTILTGLVVIFAVFIYEHLILILWPLVPVLIVAGVIATSVGWIPW